MLASCRCKFPRPISLDRPRLSVGSCRILNEENSRKNQEFKGSDPVRFLTLRGGIPRPAGEFPRSLDSKLLGWQMPPQSNSWFEGWDSQAHQGIPQK